MNHVRVIVRWYGPRGAVASALVIGKMGPNRRGYKRLVVTSGTPKMGERERTQRRGKEGRKKGGKGVLGDS